MHTRIHNITVHNSQALETTQMPINDAQTKCSAIGIQWSIVQPQKVMTFCNTDESENTFANENKLYTKGHMLDDSTYMKHLE